jgi:hypothetical protein
VHPPWKAPLRRSRVLHEQGDRGRRFSREHRAAVHSPGEAAGGHRENAAGAGEDMRMLKDILAIGRTFSRGQSHFGPPLCSSTLSHSAHSGTQRDPGSLEVRRLRLRLAGGQNLDRAGTGTKRTAARKRFGSSPAGVRPATIGDRGSGVPVEAGGDAPGQYAGGVRAGRCATKPPLR